MKADLYYESHVTINPVFDAKREEASALANRYGFKLAKLLMKKRSTDDAEDSKLDTFMTGHGQDLGDIKDRTKSLVLELQSSGYTVLRYKIEDTILDSRHSDVFGILV